MPLPEVYELAIHSREKYVVLSVALVSVIIFEWLLVNFTVWSYT